MNRRLVASATAVLVLLAGCSSGSEGDDPTVLAPSASSPASASPSSPARPSPAATVVEVSYAGGQISGAEQRVPVTLGERVVLRFTSDVAEEIHVHGYDLYTDLVPGAPAEIAFVADIPGSFEVELHEAGRPMYQLRVS